MTTLAQGAVVLLCVSCTLACDSLAALPSSTGSDSALIYAKNADRFWNEAQPVHVEPRATHAPGTMIHTLSGVSVPQVPLTYATMGSQPNWGWGYSMGVNEYSVAIGNEMFPVRDGYKSSKPRIEFTALDRLVLERSQTASEGIKVLTELISQYGQGPCKGCPPPASYNNLFMLTDPSEVYVLMTVEFQWAWKRWNSTSLVTISNHYITEFDEMSPDAKSFAQQRGWWNGKTPFNFGEVYGTNASSGYYRQLRSSTFLNDLLKQNGVVKATDLMKTLSDHEDGQDPHAPYVAEPHWTFKPEVCYHDPEDGTGGMTASSLVVDPPRDPKKRLPVILHSVVNPCTSIFIPIFFQGDVPQIIQEDQWWYTVRYLQYDVAHHNYTKVKAIRAVWEPIQKNITSSVYEIAEKAQEMNNEGRESEASNLLTNYMNSIVNTIWAAAKKLNETNF